MRKLLIFVAPLALMAAHAAAAPTGWGGNTAPDTSAAMAMGKGGPLILVQRRGGGGRAFAGGNVNRGNFSNRTFNSNNFQRNVVVNRNVNVVGGAGNYCCRPNWGSAAAGFAVGASVAAVATSAANSTYYPPPPPYPYYYPY
jgi:hypothetical protein